MASGPVVPMVGRNNNNNHICMYMDIRKPLLLLSLLVNSVIKMVYISNLISNLFYRSGKDLTLSRWDE